MSAATISSSPTAWNQLAADLRNYEETLVRDRMEETPSPRTDFDNIPSELIQFIELAQLGWGAQLGAGKRLGYWATVALLRDFLTAHANHGVPTRG